MATELKHSEESRRSSNTAKRADGAQTQRRERREQPDDSQTTVRAARDHCHRMRLSCRRMRNAKTGFSSCGFQTCSFGRSNSQSLS
eukprot:3899256-Rhodomonas_salina.1